jgi:hypothetical protein
MHIPNIRRKIARVDRPPKRRPEPPGPVPTLGELQARSSTWFWACCEGQHPTGEPCQRKIPLALAPFVIRWGPDVSSDVLRQNLRCTACGRRGAALQHPGWIDAIVGVRPFPAGLGAG